MSLEQASSTVLTSSPQTSSGQESRVQAREITEEEIALVFSHLNPQQRLVLKLRLVDGLSCQQIALGHWQELGFRSAPALQTISNIQKNALIFLERFWPNNNLSTMISQSVGKKYFWENQLENLTPEKVVYLFSLAHEPVSLDQPVHSDLCKNEVLLSEAVPDPALSPDVVATKTMGTEFLEERVLSRLSPARRTVLYLRFVKELNLDEIAQHHWREVIVSKPRTRMVRGRRRISRERVRQIEAQALKQVRQILRSMGIYKTADVF